jgi:hypothetical protein
MAVWFRRALATYEDARHRRILRSIEDDRDLRRWLAADLYPSELDGFLTVRQPAAAMGVSEAVVLVNQG